MRLLLLVYLMLNLVYFLTKITKIKTVSVYLNYCDLYFENKKQIIQSSLIVGSFVALFLVLLRILRIFYFNSKGLDLKIYYNLIFKGLVFYEQVVLLVIILVLFSLIKKYIFDRVKLHYFKLHYYYFVRFSIYNIILRFAKNHRVLIYFLVNENPQYYKIFSFIMFRAFGYIVAIILAKNLIFDNFILNIKLILCYGLYKFVCNVCYHLHLNLNYDFEQGVIQHYFPDEFCLTEFGIFRLNIYLVSLVCEPSKYDFMPNLLFFWESKVNKEYPLDWIFFSSHYNEIDVYELLKTKAPRIPD